ncbi:hypothetical protein CMUST_03220 [Corynebacterium mustelae]|uniref:Uncharacterized protein n=1 Tax=Corynebacterium mustelae TaxID=571915 RepID=A0A0G3GZK2_9CORY|nr:hypothetical protein [Corynebacterium mustelae]AKK04988.1 hypothetical protein CMUST_03220 [Corynebacterium mustelae]
MSSNLAEDVDHATREDSYEKTRIQIAPECPILNCSNDSMKDGQLDIAQRDFRNTTLRVLG